MYIDTDSLRRDLMDDYGTAAFNGFPAAIVDLGRIESLSDEELIRIAQDKGISLRKYAVDDDA